MLLAGTHPVTITPGVAVLDRLAHDRTNPPQAPALAVSTVERPQKELPQAEIAQAAFRPALFGQALFGQAL